jgi:peroxiredoxin Q/BCP
MQGDLAPPFELPDQHGRVVGLSGLRGRTVLLYFYPKADTTGCTVQSCSVRDARRELEALGVVALGVSPDQPSDQAAFDEKYGLGFPLLSDPDLAVAEAYGAWGERTGSSGEPVVGIIRSSFLIDGEGRILGVWSPVTPEDTVPNALEALHARGR